MNDRLWLVSSKFYYGSNKETVTVFGVNKVTVNWDLYDEYSLVESHGIYCGCYRETEEFTEYADFFYNVGDAEAFAQARKSLSL
jgi:hypothetical protein